MSVIVVGIIHVLERPYATLVLETPESQRTMDVLNPPPVEMMRDLLGVEMRATLSVLMIDQMTIGCRVGFCAVKLIPGWDLAARRWHALRGTPN